jgi:uncharacterized membrane protein SpoIIM required for sporulation
VKSVDFRRERETTWQELEALVARVESHGIRSLSAVDVSRLPVLYRATLSSLSVARAISLDANVLGYLESLGERAYFAVYATKTHPLETLRAFALERFPAAVRGMRRQVALSALLLMLGIATGMLLTQTDSNRFYILVSEDYAQGRGPSATTEELRSVLYKKDATADWLTAFAMFLFSHNAGLGIAAFALGFAAGVPTLLLLFANGLTLGAFVALYTERGLGLEFWAWVLPHGVTELLAIVLCGAAGLVVADSLLFPGRHTRLENLTSRGREAGLVVMGSVVLFLLAGLIEGIFRQSVTWVPLRLALALVSAVAWTLYFTGAGAEKRT